MSVGHLRYETKPRAELYAILGQGDTAQFKAQPVKLDHSYDVADAGGISVDRKTVFIDEEFYNEIMSGRVRVRGMQPRQVVSRIIDHEHTEKVVMDGDNAVNTYPPAHEFATTDEHEGVEEITGKDAEIDYEPGLSDGIKRCMRRFLAKGRSANPPKELWCGPHLDDPTDDDRKVLDILRAKGVEDAHKVSKETVNYGVGPEQCRDCRHFGGVVVDGSGPLRKCEIVSGLVRDKLWCKRWSAKK